MSKKKIALFYDDSSESGKQILAFLRPFDKRKSDIVGELILMWIAEHGTNVPVQWLDRKHGSPGTYRPEDVQSVPFGKQATTDREIRNRENMNENQQNDFKAQWQEPLNMNKQQSKPKISDEPSGPAKESQIDDSLIMAGLASFM